MKTARHFCFVILASLVAPATHAGLITFDGPPSIGFLGDTLSTQDFDFTTGVSPGGVGAFIEFGFSRDLGGLFNANGARIDMTRTDNAVFDLQSFQLSRRQGDTSYNRSASSIDIVGTLSGGGNVTFNTGSLTESYSAIILPTSFTGLTSVAFNPLINANNGTTNFEFLIDDLNVMDRTPATVPAPASLALLGLGLLGFRLRRK